MGLGDDIQDAVFPRQLPEPPQVLGPQGQDHSGRGVSRQLLGAGPADDLPVRPGQGQQQGGGVLDAGGRQFYRRLAGLQGLPDQQVGHLAAHVHPTSPPIAAIISTVEQILA